jgi:EAL domain-containing protein (putative c-di-GMP-specific phosphodiesterase class I)
VITVERILEHAARLVPTADGAALTVCSDAGSSCVAACGTMSPYVGTRSHVTGALAERALAEGRAVCAELAGDPLHATVAAVPLLWGSHRLGVLTIALPGRGVVEQTDVEQMQELGGLVAPALAVALTRAAEVGTDGSASAASAAAVLAIESRARAPDPWPSPTGAGRSGIIHPEAGFAVRRRIERTAARSHFAVWYQPIIHLHDGELIGVEALTRFHGPPGPEQWFRDAQRFGLGVELELACCHRALEELDVIAQGAFISINVGPETIQSPRLRSWLRTVDVSRVVLELTEHHRVEDYSRLRSSLARLRNRGLRLAVDDVGAGFSNLRHILELSPEVVKLDRAFTRDIDIDGNRRALARALVAFAEETGADVIAEGIETEEQLGVLRKLNVLYGQGYFLGAPAPVASRPTEARPTLTRIR